MVGFTVTRDISARQVPGLSFPVTVVLLPLSKSRVRAAAGPRPGMRGRRQAPRQCSRLSQSWMIIIIVMIRTVTVAPTALGLMITHVARLSLSLRPQFGIRADARIQEIAF